MMNRKIRFFNQIVSPSADMRLIKDIMSDNFCIYFYTKK